METFVFEEVTYTVKEDKEGKIVYRDQAHLGGPWSDASKTICNKSIKIGFRRLLSNAVLKLQ